MHASTGVPANIVASRRMPNFAIYFTRFESTKLND
jgi:hypothetical protein